MLTSEDIQKIIEAFRQIRPTRNEYRRSFEELRQEIQALTLRINNLIQKYD